MAFSPDGKSLATAGDDKKVKVWDIASSRLVREMKGHTDVITAVAWSADSATLTSAGHDGTVRQWNLTRDYEAGAGQNSSPEMSACFTTDCNAILDLAYSTERTLSVFGATRVGEK